MERRTGEKLGLGQQVFVCSDGVEEIGTLVVNQTCVGLSVHLLYAMYAVHVGSYLE